MYMKKLTSPKQGFVLVDFPNGSCVHFFF